MDKYKKKLAKKASKGQISTIPCYQACVALGIKATNAIRFIEDKTRENSKHKLNLWELSDLLLHVLSYKSIPKQFEVTNTPFLRNVVLLHFFDCDDIYSLDGINTTDVPKAIPIRLSKQPEICSLLPQILLTTEEEVDDEEGKDLVGDHEQIHISATENSNTIPNTNNNSYDPYILSPYLMSLWGYPIASKTNRQLTIPNKYSKNIDIITETVEKNSNRKRLREDTEEDGKFHDIAVTKRQSCDIVAASNMSATFPHSLPVTASTTSKGVRVGSLPTIHETNRILSALAGALLVQVLQRSVGGDVEEKDMTAAGEYRPSGMTSMDKIELEVATITETSTVIEAGVDTDKTAVSEVADEYYYQTISRTSDIYHQLWTESDTAIDPPTSTSRRVITIDCEMCDTSTALEVTRISVVDEDGTVLLDSYVCPDTPILNYRTQWSGITPEIMSQVTIRLSQIQLFLLRLITTETVLIGHALENDLKVLKICHNRCVDTSIMYPHIRGFPLRRKLKTLAKDYLFIDIQSSDNGMTNVLEGHDSVEDARTTLALAKLKLEKGYTFGHHIIKKLNGKQQTNIQPLLSKISPVNSIKSSFFLVGQDQLRRMRCCVGGNSDLNVCDSNNTAIQKLTSFITSTAIKRKKMANATAVAGSGMQGHGNQSSGSLRVVQDLLLGEEFEIANKTNKTTSAPIINRNISLPTAVASSAQSLHGITFGFIGLNWYDVVPICSTSTINVSSNKSPTRNTSNSTNLTECVSDNTMATKRHAIDLIVNRIEENIRNTSENGLIIITSQKSLQPVEKLMKQKRVCMTAMCASTWSDTLEKDLKQAIVDANYGTVQFRMVNSM